MKYVRLSLGVVALAAAGYLWLQFGAPPGELTAGAPPNDPTEPAVDSAARTDPRQGASDDSGDNSTVRAQGSAAPALPLPPLDARISLIIDDLKARADSGDVRAKCRLSYELYRCRQLPALSAMVERYVAGAAGKPEGSEDEAEQRAVALRLSERVERDSMVCEGLNLSSAESPWQYLSDAARRGHVPSMLRFVIQPPLDENNFIEDIKGWEEYRREAGRYLQRAAALGDPTAAYYLFLAQSGFPMPGGAQIVERDDEAALIYGYVARSLANSQSQQRIETRINRLANSLDRSEVSDAERRARDLLARQYARSRQNIDFSDNPIPQDPSDCEL